MKASMQNHWSMQIYVSIVIKLVNCSTLRIIYSQKIRMICDVKTLVGSTGQNVSKKGWVLRKLWVLTDNIVLYDKKTTERIIYHILNVPIYFKILKALVECMDLMWAKISNAQTNLSYFSKKIINRLQTALVCAYFKF